MTLDRTEVVGIIAIAGTVAFVAAYIVWLIWFA